MVENLWSEKDSLNLVGVEELVYRSNLLGSDRAVCNWGGGNTSMKTIETDFKGEEVEVMWVKGSGSDLATMDATNFTALKLQDILPLKQREDMSDEEMTLYLKHCMLEPAHPKSSIETLLHAFLSYKHVDHTHPDAIISICCADNGKEIADEVFGEKYVWVPYIRPGFKLSKMIAEAVEGNPEAELVLMEKHGLVTWGETSEESYQRTIEVIRKAESFINKQAEDVSLFGGQKYLSLDTAQKSEILGTILPKIRGFVSKEEQAVLAFSDKAQIMEFVNSYDAETLSQIGAACPDHLVHTKRTPLYVEWDCEKEDIDKLVSILEEGIEEYRSEYLQYVERNKQQGDVLRNASPRVILIPGIGMINTGKDRKAADVSGALYERAVAVMRGSTVLGNFTSLTEEESFNVEYWPLELYKLTLSPPEAEFSRKVAFITGGAGGIGSACCERLAKEGAHIVIADLNEEGAKKTAEELNAKFGAKTAFPIKMDVTKEAEVQHAFAEAILHYGGIDIVVNNAGLATSSPFEETTLDEWNLNMNVLTTGYFLVSREGFKIMKEQQLGGSQVFIGSKNSIYAGKNASAYSTAKAAEVHLARCIAAEGGAHGIRVNSVLPDAVLQGSAIWDSNWRKERAASYGIHPDELENHYKKRTTLLVNIFPHDIAEAVAFFASSKAAKSTGNMVAVDGGVPAAFTR
ncbi:bifunctional aldolase/short-chain dehydrogenase [Virgibacillus halodenitrificans]|uniref:bifunctional aldolase/short-chain dehydrogenase n=1 Tax=Virgibacillus halodenitrificans TaxID=1482 RepID=UPI001FB2045A|nr:bifunctional aldolase/short-chain dehydrogenase [Virgibacillus halodenitrificans]MCJ0929660.1 bifunctional aldolase/short-chain dehydrogenase [Virgibacillus halodenitrificans]